MICDGWWRPCSDVVFSALRYWRLWFRFAARKEEEKSTKVEKADLDHTRLRQCFENGDLDCIHWHLSSITKITGAGCKTDLNSRDLLV